MKTKAQLSTSVLRKLRVVDAIETPAATDAALVEDAYDSKLAEWRRLGRVWWTNTNRSTEEIPDEVFDVLRRLIANAVMDDYGLRTGGVSEEQMEKQLLRDLKALNHKPPSGESTGFSSF